MSKRGVPTEYTPELATLICNYIAEGLSLRKLCEKDDIPVRPETIRVWLGRHEDFAVQYAHARDEQADKYADDITDIAMDTLEGKYDSQNARVAIDALKWTASKLKPKKYGDRLDHTTNGKDLPAPILGGLTQFNITDGNKDK